MKAQLKFPVFIFKPKGNMVYVFWREKLYKTTNTKIFKTIKKGDIVIDSNGMKYIEKKVYMTKWRGIYGYFAGMQGRVIAIEYEYEDNLEKISLEQLKTMIVERYPKSWAFKSQAWVNAEDFKRDVFRCTTFEEVASILVTPPSKNAFLRFWRGH